MTQDLTILGLESSCDDTAAAVVRRTKGRGEILSNVVLGQDGLHAAFGGIVPEIAARAHAEKIDLAVEAALDAAGLTLQELDAIAVTAGPGLIGGVLAGVMCAKGLSAATGLPLVGREPPRRARADAPADGRTGLSLSDVAGVGRPLPLPARRGARRLRPARRHDRRRARRGLRQGRPPARAAAARRPCRGNLRAGATAPVRLPRPLLDRPGCDLSFSGLKTAVLRARDAIVEEHGGLPGGRRADLCAGFQDAVRDVLAEKSRRALALGGVTAFAVAGGVAANAPLRAALRDVAADAGVPFVAPPHALCTDNAAMIAWAGAELFAAGHRDDLSTVRAPPLAAGPGRGPDAGVRQAGGEGVIGVLGAGAFGTALAVALAQAGRPVALWGRDAEAMAEAARSRRLPRLPDVPLPDGVMPTAAASDLAGCDTLIVAIPVQRLAGALADLPLRPRHAVAACKGLDLATLRGPTAILAQAFPGAVTAILSGPSFAVDIARGRPTALSLGCVEEAVGIRLQGQLSTPSLRLYRTTDVAGVELGGALKNVVAIACGAAVGAGLGDSARAALMTRGMAEMLRLAPILGARPGTLMGLSGLGDLALTCASPQSRNFALGHAIGAGTPRPDATVEGAATAEAVLRLAETHALDLPIAAAVAALVAGRLTVEDAIHRLLDRDLTAE